MGRTSAPECSIVCCSAPWPCCSSDTSVRPSWSTLGWDSSWACADGPSFCTRSSLVRAPASLPRRTKSPGGPLCVWHHALHRLGRLVHLPPRVLLRIPVRCRVRPPAEPDLQPGGLREQDLVLPGYLGRRQDRDPPGHPEQIPVLNEQGRQCRFIDFGFFQPRVALAFPVH